MHGPMSSISSWYTVPKRSCPSKLLRLALLCGLLGLAAALLGACSNEPGPTATADSSTTPAATAVAEPTVNPTPTPVSTPMPTPEPTAMPTPMPTPEPTAMPTPIPTPEPTAVPTPNPCPTGTTGEDWVSEDFWSNADLAQVEAELRCGADIGARDEYNWTPLHNAAWSNENPQVVRALLDAGADVQAKTDSSFYAPASCCG